MPETLSPFAALPPGDVALGWIDLLFHGHGLTNALPYAKSLVTLADSLRQALGLYNVALLIIGAFLLFYHVVAMIAETAQEGIMFGRRANKIWTPIRLVVAVGLLVPVSGGLSSGQYLIVKLAEAGSRVASNAWQTIAIETRDTLATLVTPRLPNVAALVATATEMEVCRVIYQTAYSQFIQQPNADPSVQLLGPIGDITKLPAGRLGSETWRYSNTLNASVPLCGEYNFGGYRPYDVVVPAGDNADLIDHAAADLQSFAHMETSDLITQATSLAGRNALALTTPGSAASVDMRSDIAALTSDIQTRLEAQLKFSGIQNTQFAAQMVDQSIVGGWLSAASLIPQLMRLQEGYGELVSHALPEAVEPLFDHALPTRQVMLDALDSRSPLTPTLTMSEINLVGFYGQISRIMAPLRSWMDDNEAPRGSVIPASGLDLRDRLNVATDSLAALNMFAAAIDTRATADGVWGSSISTQDNGNPFAFTNAFAAANPFTAMAEFGRRQYQLGAYMFGLSGSGVMVPGAAAAAVLTGLAALLLLGGGCTLIFVVPFLPFFRFMIAALIWLLNVFEAVVAMPIVALAHLTPHGAGLSGSTARQAYSLWLALIIRPLLALSGLVVGYVLLAVGLNLFVAALASFAHGAAATNGGLLIVANLALVAMFDVFVYATTNAAFKGIDWLPDQALRWISPYMATEMASEPMPTVAPMVGMPNVTATASVNNMIASQGGAVNISAGASSSISGSTGATTHSNSLKAALFPAYHQGVADVPLPSSLETPAVNLSSPHVTLQVTGHERNRRADDKSKMASQSGEKKLGGIEKEMPIETPSEPKPKSE